MLVPFHCNSSSFPLNLARGCNLEWHEGHDYQEELSFSVAMRSFGRLLRYGCFGEAFPDMNAFFMSSRFNRFLNQTLSSP